MREVYTSDNERLVVALLKNDSAGAGRLADGGKVRPEVVLRLADRHMVAGIVADRLSRLFPQAVQDNPAFRPAGSMVRAAAARNMMLRWELKLAAEILERNEIEFLLIKGFSVDKDPLRVMDDLDILVRETDLEKTFSVLETAGYRYTGSAVMSEGEIREPFETLDWNNQFQFLSPSGRAGLEVHTNLFERGRIRLENLNALLDNVELFWEGRVRDDELGCFVPSPEAGLALLCVHATTKRSPAHNTFIIRHAYDIEGMLRRGMDAERFLRLCGRWKIEYFARTALRLTALCLGTETPREIAARLEPVLTPRQRRLSDIHLGCYRGLDHSPFFRRKLYALLMPSAVGGGIGNSIRWYLRQVFPPLWAQEKRFGVPRTSPAICLTYLYGPFVRAWDILKRSVPRG